MSVVTARYNEGTLKAGTLAFDGEYYTLIPDFWSTHPLIRGSSRTRNIPAKVAGEETVAALEQEWLEKETV
jgi:hypothetical protein